MSGVEIATAIMNLLAGIGIFLVACSMMSKNLEAASSSRLKGLFEKASKSKMLGVGIGALGTAAIQSSGATTVMVIGFVNAGIMSLFQAATVIYGANIGTTITGQIVALGMFGSGNSISTTVIFSAMAGVGAFVNLFAKKDSHKLMGGIITGFGMLFVGLSMMSGSMNSFGELDSVKQFLAAIDNMFLLVLIGAILTAIVQSSSVMTSVAITMVVAGLISLNQGIFLTMGSNIGSCAVALIAGLSSGKNAKRTSFVHLLFNVSGVVMFLIISILLSVFSGGSLDFGVFFEKMFPGAPQTQLAMFHTVFNIATVVIMLPLTGALVNIVTKIVPDREEPSKDEGPKFFFYDSNMLRTPPIAVAQIKNEIVNMASIAMENYKMSLEIITTLDFSSKDLFIKNEKELNYLNNNLVGEIVALSKKSLNEEDRKYISTAIRTLTDLERIGDYAVNILEYAENLSSHGQHFSEMALEEIKKLYSLIEEIYNNVIKAYKEKDIVAFKKADVIEDEVDYLTEQMAQNHLERLNEGKCTPLVGAQYLELASNSERIADHFINVGKTIKDLI